MKTTTALLIVPCLFCINATMLTAQVAINNSAANPDSSAILDLNSGNAGVNKGFLPPQVALTDVSSAVPVVKPATGLIVYSITAPTGGNGSGYYYWSGLAWVNLGASALSSVTGSGTNNYVARWTPNGNTLGTGLMQDNGTGVGIDTVPVPYITLFVNSNSGDGMEGYSANYTGISGNGATYGVKGYASDTSGKYAGVVGEDDYGAGVWGYSANATGVYGNSAKRFGIYGVTADPVGEYAGVLGRDDNNIGVWGYSANYSGVFGNSAKGYGVYGITADSDGGHAGIFGRDDSNKGVWGYSSNYTGVFGNSAKGTGVYGITADSGGKYAGVYGRDDSNKGIWGYSSNYTGVYGNSAKGTGVYGVTADSGGKNAGVYGRDDNDAGVWGYSANYTGVYGNSGKGYGVYGYTADSNGVYAGVLGRDDNNYGVWGYSANATGVYGNSANKFGIYGISTEAGHLYAGVYGEDDNHLGVWGYSANGAGVYGNGGSHGVYGISTNGNGVFGYSTNRYGVFGFATPGTGSVGVHATGDTAESVYANFNGINVYSGFIGINVLAGEGIKAVANSIAVYATAASTGVEGFSTSSLYQGIYGGDDNNVGVEGFSKHKIGIWGAGGTTGGIFEDSLNDYATLCYGLKKAGGYFADGGGDYSYIAYNGSAIVSNVPKSTEVKDENNQERMLFCNESPEVMFEDYGEGQLVKGKAHIALDPLFARNVAINEKHPLRVFIQLEENESCKGVVTKNKSATGFDVIELNGGVSSTPFEWHIVCNRANEAGTYHNFADKRFPMGPGPIARTPTPAAGPHLNKGSAITTATPSNTAINKEEIPEKTKTVVPPLK